MVLLVPSLALVVLQVLLYRLVAVVEGSDDPMSPTITPLNFLAINVSLGVTGVLAISLLAWLAKVPWRSLISSPRAFDAHRLRYYLVAAAALVAGGIGVVAIVAPDSPGWVSFGVSGTTVTMLALTLVSTPIQSAGEELVLRGAVLPAAASWVRAEAPVAFHVADNVLFSVVNTLMADGEPFAIDRSTDTGDASLLVLAAVDVTMVGLVWLRERADTRSRRRAAA